MLRVKKSGVVWPVAAMLLVAIAARLFWGETAEALPAEASFPWDRTGGRADAVLPPAPLQPLPAAPFPAQKARPDEPAQPVVFDVCGLARVSAPPGSAADIASGGLDALPAPLGREPLAQVRERVLGNLRAGNPSSRVAALLLDKPDGDNPHAMLAWAQAVLQQARDSRSAVALGWAEQACGYLPDGAACRLGLIRARLSLEPDNGHHWAALADEDPAAADEAWRGLRQAQRWHEAPQALMLITQAALPADVPVYLRLALGVEISAKAGRLPTPGEGFLQERCSAAAAQRGDDCGALAQLLVDRGDSVHGLAQGRKLAQQAGWPAERLDRLQRELRAFEQPDEPWAIDNSQPLSCASTDAWQRHVSSVGALGELGALRARAALVAANVVRHP